MEIVRSIAPARASGRARAFAAVVVGLGLLATAGGARLFAQSYDPVGPQVGVDEWVVEGGGWSLCFASQYAVWTGPWMPTLEALCTGEKLMLACQFSASSTISLLAAAPREEVLYDCGDGEGDSHLANGARWYHSHGGTGTGADSWGFAPADAFVVRDSCDGADDDAAQRLCWHLNEDGGYRCGAVEDLNGSPGYWKLLYRYTSAVFADGFEGPGDVCGWSQASGAADDCSQTLVLALEPSCGATVVDQGASDLDPEPGRIGFRFSWGELRREWGYRLEIDYETPFESEQEFVELPADTSETPIRICEYPQNCSWTFRLLAHVGHWGGHGPAPEPGDLVSNDCSVVTDWGE